MPCHSSGRINRGGPVHPGLLSGLLLFLLSAVATHTVAGEDPLQVWAGLDVDRHVLMSPYPCLVERLSETIPGLSAPTGSCLNSSPPDSASNATPVSVALGTRYRNLIHKPGLPGFSHDDLTSTLDVGLRLTPFLEVRSVWETTDNNRSFQDSSVRFASAPASPDWRMRSSLAVTYFPAFVPLLAAGAGTDGSRELAVGGRVRASGLTVTLAGGWKNLDLPITLDLPDYRALTLPLMLRQTFQVLSVEGRFLNLELYMMSRFRQDKHPSDFDAPYSLSDSGQSREHFAGAAWSSTGSAGRYRLSLEGEHFEGRKVFRGTRSSNEGLYQFAYEETRQRSAWVRADAQAGRGRREAGVFVGAGAVRWDALRPEIASGHYFWDRNGVLDSYEGSLLDIFSQETYLFDGRVGLSQQSVGSWVSLPAGLWQCRLGLSYHHLEMEAYGRLTKKSTTFIITYTEREYAFNFYGVEADLLTPELYVKRQFGRAFVEASVEQALPLRIRMRKDPASGSGATSGKPSSSKSSGGTEAAVRVGWGFL